MRKVTNCVYLINNKRLNLAVISDKLVGMHGQGTGPPCNVCSVGQQTNTPALVYADLPLPESLSWDQWISPPDGGGVAYESVFAASRAYAPQRKKRYIT